MNPLQVIDFHFLNICLNQSRGVYTCFVLASFARKGLCYEHVHTWMEKQATWEKRGKRQQHRLSKVTTWMTKRDPRQEYFKQLHYWHIWPQWSFREQMTLVGRVLVTSFRDAIRRTYTDSAIDGKKILTDCKIWLVLYLFISNCSTFFHGSAEVGNHLWGSHGPAHCWEVGHPEQAGWPVISFWVSPRMKTPQPL